MLPGLSAIAGFAAGGSAGSFTVEISTDHVSRTMSTNGPDKVVTTSPVTVTASGGGGSYSYGWARSSGSTAITATAPSAASTQFTATLSSEDRETAEFTCTVTDIASGATQSITVVVTLTLIGWEV
jgi:hypothetical protein